MATIAVTSDLDVLDKYKSLIKQSLDSESVYIRTKETLEDIFENSSFTNKEKSEILSQVLISLNGSLVNASMGTAMQWSNAEKEVELKKLELAKQLDILDEEIKVKQEQHNKLYYETIATQAQTIRQFGTPVVLDGNVTGLSDSGKVAKEIEVMEQQRLNALQENVLIQSKQKESQAAIHKVVADTYTNFGNFTYTVGVSGVTDVNDLTPLDDKDSRLAYLQGVIAKEQAKGYTYNLWANALVASSSTLGTLLTSEQPVFDGNAAPVGTTFLNYVTDFIDDIKSKQPPSLS